MRIHRSGYWKLGASVALVMSATTALYAGQSAVPAGFKPLFDGKTLNGWRGDSTLWSVRDGVIVGGSDQPIQANTFLIFDKPYGNFEIRYKYRWLSPDGNSGLQFRSGQVEGNYVMTGYQANVTPTNVPEERFGMLYNELADRQELALLGQKAEITRRSSNGAGTGRVVRTVTAMVNQRSTILKSIRPNPEWNEVVLIAYGNHMVEAINGLLAFDAVDKDPVGRLDGLFGLQLHKGPAMRIEYKDIVIKPLTAAPKLEGRFVTSPAPAPAPTRTYKDSTRAALPDVALPE